jgi:hypothetical protein
MTTYFGRPVHCPECKGDSHDYVICVPSRTAHLTCRRCKNIFTKHLHPFGDDDRRRLSSLKLRAGHDREES